MTFILLPEAQRSITEISDFIDAVNTSGAGERWVERMIDSIESFARSAEHVTYALCTNEAFASKGLSCFNFNDWIIAFKAIDEVFEVHFIVRGSILP